MTKKKQENLDSEIEENKNVVEDETTKKTIENEVEDETLDEVEDETLDKGQDDDEDEKDQLIEKLQKENDELEKKNKQLYARTKKNEINTGITQEDLLKVAKGLTEEDIKDAKMLAQRDGIRMVEVLDTDDFKLLKSARDKKQAQQEAQLGASKGKKVFKQKTLQDTGLSREEHKKLFQEKINEY